MAYHISQTDPDTIVTEDLLAEIGSFKVMAVEVVERLSLILRVLRKRRVRHDFFSDRILCFWESIAGGTLAAEAAILLANQNTIKAILPLPRDRQIAIARGELVPVATLQPSGEIKSDDLPIQRMDPATLRRAFGPNGMRSVHDQAEMIRAEGKIERRGMFTVLRDEGAVKLGNQKFTPTDPDVRAAFRALGFEIVLARDVPRGEAA